MITFEEIPWDCLVRLRIDSEIEVSQTRMQTACTGCDFDDLLVIERRKGYVDRVVSAREITIQNLADEDLVAFAVQQEGVGAAVLGLIARVWYQCEPNVIVAKQPKQIVTICISSPLILG